MFVFNARIGLGQYQRFEFIRTVAAIIVPKDEIEQVLIIKSEIEGEKILLRHIKFKIFRN